MSLPENAETISLPHTWNATDGQDGGNDYFRGSCCYIKEIDKKDLPKGDLYFLEINGANSSADVYVNDKKVAHHDGGYSTWRVNITDALSDSNRIAIVVDNAMNETVYPQTADFTFYGGLYRNVNIIAVPESHFELEYFGTLGIKVTSRIMENDAEVEVEVYAVKSVKGLMFRYAVYDADKNLVGMKITCYS